MSALPLPVSPAKSAGLGLWLRDLLISAGISVLIITFLYQPVRVEGTSMLAAAGGSRPALHQQIRLPHRVDPARRCGGVSLSARSGEELHQARDRAARRQDLRIDHGQVWVNGKALDESYVPDRCTATRARMAEMVIPEESYFMMGDHRSISSDSREFGPVERDLIYGKAVFVYWPARDAGVVR